MTVPASDRAGGRAAPAAPSRVDGHVHLWDPAVHPQPWMGPDRFTPIRRRFDLAALAAAAAGTGVTRAVLIQNLASTAESRDLLACAAGAAGLPRIAGVVGWVDLQTPDVDKQIAALRAAPGGQLLVGIRHPVQDEPDPAWLIRPNVLSGLAAVAAAGLSFDVLTRPDQLPAAVQAVRSVPSCRFVVDHLAKPPITAGMSGSAGKDWLIRIGELAAEPNVALKVSGVLTGATRPWTIAELRPWVQEVIEAFGPARVMSASDWPVCLLTAPYPTVVAAHRELTAGLTVGDRDAIEGMTAQRWYRLAG